MLPFDGLSGSSFMVHGQKSERNINPRAVNKITSYRLAGVLPQTITQTGHPTSVVFALDLSVVVPLSLIWAILLWKRRAWG